MNKRRGIILIALGNPYYGNLASNLAASIRATAPNLEILLIWGEDAIAQLDQSKLNLFHQLLEAPPELYHRKGKKSYVKAKTRIYDLSPFTETIFLDVDTILLPKHSISEAFDEFNRRGIDFTMENRSRVNLAENRSDQFYLWADIKDIRKTFGFKSGHLYGLHSEFIYFKKSKRIEKYFETVKEIYENPRIKLKEFDGDIPDEFAFAMAMIKHDIYPHQCPYVPLYWYLTDKAKGSSLSYCIENYIGYSVGGNATPATVRKRYNQLAKSYFGRLGLQHPFPIRQKRQVLASRKIM